MKKILVIPTYNEKATLPELLSQLDALSLGFDILFVDDNSPDGTAALVQEWTANRQDIFLLNRPGKLGLGTAYKDGFNWALLAGYDIIVQMDADLSHDPQYLAGMLAMAQPNTLVIGSR